jgi:hypothetical protein
MNVKKNNWLIGFLGKIFFRGQAPWQQRANVRVTLWAVAAGVLTGGVIVAFLLLRNAR